MDSTLGALGAYLRARRNVTQPEDVGIVREPGRRVPGLRRDEVAALSGISSEYYLRIEQGRGARPSDQVLTALARALRLDAEARAYMFRIATGMQPASFELPEAAADVREQIARVLSQWTHTPAYISDQHRDIVAANALAAAFGFGGLSVGSNQVVGLFNERMKSTLVEWEVMTRSAVATLRRDADPRSPRLAQLVALLSDDPDFVRIWQRHDVSGPEDAVFHIQVDSEVRIEVEGQNFAVRSLPGYQLTVLSAPPGGPAERMFARIAAVEAAARP